MTTDVDRLMKRCQVGVGGRRALDEAHDILSECYGTLGRQQIEIERLRAELAEMTADRDSWAEQASQRTQDAVDLVAKERERCAKLCEDFIGQLGPVDRATIDCWRQNYGLDKPPQELFAFWHPLAPAGAVLALKAAVRALERAQEWIEGDCTCPCCEGVQECGDGCTFAADCPSDANRMESARAVLFGAPNAKVRRTQRAEENDND